jgi:hypothetical protein
MSDGVILLSVITIRRPGPDLAGHHDFAPHDEPRRSYQCGAQHPLWVSGVRLELDTELPRRMFDRHLTFKPRLDFSDAIAYRA